MAASMLLSSRVAPALPRRAARRAPRAAAVAPVAASASASAAAPSRRALLAAGAASLSLAFATPLPALAAGGEIMAVADLPKPYRQQQRNAYQQELIDLLKAEVPALDQRALVRLFFNDAAAGGRDGSVHLRCARRVLLRGARAQGGAARHARACVRARAAAMRGPRAARPTRVVCMKCRAARGARGLRPLARCHVGYCACGHNRRGCAHATPR
jgi:hypothetical protein